MRQPPTPASPPPHVVLRHPGQSGTVTVCVTGGQHQRPGPGARVWCHPEGASLRPLVMSLCEEQYKGSRR